MKAIHFDLEGCLVESETFALEVIADAVQRLGARGLEASKPASEALGLHKTRIAHWVARPANRPVSDDFATCIDTLLM